MEMYSLISILKNLFIRMLELDQFQVLLMEMKLRMVDNQAFPKPKQMNQLMKEKITITNSPSLN